MRGSISQVSKADPERVTIVKKKIHPEIELKPIASIDSNSGRVLLDEKDNDTHDEPRRSARLIKPRRSARVNKVSWINNDLNDLKFMTYADDRVYKNEEKIEIVPISDSNKTNINNTTLEHPIKSNRKVHFKSPSPTSKKIKALAAMVLGTMVSSFNTMIDNHTVNPGGITKNSWSNT